MTSSSSSSSSSTTNSLIDEISSHFLTCEICSETFRRPKILQCLHTFCEECLEIRYAIEEQERTYRFLLSRSLSCPLCFAKTDLPPGGVRRLPDNAVVTQLDDVIRRRKLSSASSTSGVRSCDICSGAAGGVASSASAKCLECSKMLCRNCVEQHRKMKVTRDHCLFDVQVGKDIECKVHRDEEVRFFCDQCQTCICVVCTFHDHSGHTIFSVSEGIERYADGARALLDAARLRSGALRSQVEAIRRCEAGIKAAEESIRDATFELIAGIRRRERDLMAQLKAAYSTESAKLMAQKDPLADKLRSANATCDLVDTLLRQRSVEFLLVHREVTDKLNAIVQCPVKDLPKEMTVKNVRFTPCAKRPFDSVGHLHVSTPADDAYDCETTEDYVRSFQKNGVPPTNSTSSRHDLRLDVTVAADSEVDNNSDWNRYPPEAAELLLRNRIQSASALRPPSPRGPDVWVPPKQRLKTTPAAVMTDTKFTTTTTVYTVDRSTMTSLRTTLDKNTTTDYLVVSRDQETFTSPPIQFSVSLQTDGPKRCSRSVQSCPDTLNKPTMTRRPVLLERETNTPAAPARFDCEVTARVLGDDKATETRTLVTVNVEVGTEEYDDDFEYSVASSSRDRSLENSVKHDGEDCARADSWKEDSLLSLSSYSSSSPLTSSSSPLSSSCSSSLSNTNAGNNCYKNCQRRCQKELTCFTESKAFTCSECLNNKSDCERSSSQPGVNQSSKDTKEGLEALESSSDEPNRRISTPDCVSIESFQRVAAGEEKTPDCQVTSPAAQTITIDEDVTSAEQTNSEPTRDVSQSHDVISKADETCEIIGDRLERVTDCGDIISQQDSAQLGDSQETIETKEHRQESNISRKNTVPDLVTSTLVGDKAPDCAAKGAEESEVRSGNFESVLIPEHDSDSGPMDRIPEQMRQDSAKSARDSNYQHQIKPAGNLEKRDGVVMEDSVLPEFVKLSAVVMRQSISPEFVTSLTKTQAQMERLLPEISKIATSFETSPAHGALFALLATISALLTKACTKSKVLSDALDDKWRDVPDFTEDILSPYTERASSPVRIPTRDMETSTRVSVATRDSSTESLPPRVEIGVQSRRVVSVNRETSMETVVHLEKETSTPTVHLLNKNTATDNQVSVDACTTMSADVTAAYMDAAARPVRRFSRGTSTPLRPSPVDRASSPVRFACADKAVMARKGEALEPVDTFPGMGKTKGRRPFIVSRSLKAKLECISEGTIEEEEPEDDGGFVSGFRVKVVHRSVTAVKDGQRSFANVGKVDFPISPRPRKSSRNFFNFSNFDLHGKGQRATVSEEGEEEDAFDP